MIQRDVPRDALESAKSWMIYTDCNKEEAEEEERLHISRSGCRRLGASPVRLSDHRGERGEGNFHCRLGLIIGQQKYILPYREERESVAPGGSYLHVSSSNFRHPPTRSKRAGLLYRVETCARCPNEREIGGPELKICGKRADVHGKIKCTTGPEVYCRLVITVNKTRLAASLAIRAGRLLRLGEVGALNECVHHGPGMEKAGTRDSRGSYERGQSGPSKMAGDILPNSQCPGASLVSGAGGHSMCEGPANYGACLRLKNTVGLHLKFVPKSWSFVGGVNVQTKLMSGSDTTLVNINAEKMLQASRPIVVDQAVGMVGYRETRQPDYPEAGDHDGLGVLIPGMSMEHT